MKLADKQLTGLLQSPVKRVKRGHSLRVGYYSQLRDSVQRNEGGS